jgi:hypothetical protein
MAKIIIDCEHLKRLAELDEVIRAINNIKIEVLFNVIGIEIPQRDFKLMLEWNLIVVAVPDKQLAVQLNKLSAYIPNLKFIVDLEQQIFAVSPGAKARRVWK